MPKPTLFVVTDELQQALNNLPALEPKSRLEPLKPFILRWRREGRSYRNILEILRRECRLKVAYGPLYRFVKSRSRSRKPKQEPEVEFEGAQPTTTPPASQPTPGKRLSPEERAAQVEFIRSLNQPTSQEQPEKQRWNFDVDKPRTLHKP